MQTYTAVMLQSKRAWSFINITPPNGLVDIGTFPKSINNPLLGFTNYDQRQEVEGGAMRAWGELIYLHPLTEKQMDDYELKPAHDNPDRAKRPSIAAQLKAAQRPEPSREAAPKKHDYKDR